MDAQEPSEQDVMAAIRAKRVAAGTAPAQEQQQTQQEEQASGTPNAADPAAGEAQQQGEQASALEPAGGRYTVKVKGDDGAETTEEVTLDELTSGYLRNRDYTLKTQEVAKARSELPQQLEKAAAEARGEYLKGLQQIEQFVQAVVAPEFRGIDWEQLSKENPAEWIRLANRRAQVENTLKVVRSQTETQRLQAEAKEKEARKARADESISTLKREIPGWNDEIYNKLLAGASKAYGYTTQEYGDRLDARDLLVLNDALKYRDLMAKKPAATEALRNAPAAIRPGASVPRTDIDQARVEKARKALSESGDVDDAVALMRAKRTRKG